LTRKNKFRTNSDIPWSKRSIAAIGIIVFIAGITMGSLAVVVTSFVTQEAVANSIPTLVRMSTNGKKNTK